MPALCISILTHNGIIPFNTELVKSGHNLALNKIRLTNVGGGGYIALTILQVYERLNIIRKVVVIQGLLSKPQWSADRFFYQGTFSPLLTQQIGGEGTLEKLIQDKRISNYVGHRLDMNTVHTSRSVVMRIRLESERNSFMTTSLVFCSMSPC